MIAFDLAVSFTHETQPCFQSEVFGLKTESGPET